MSFPIKKIARHDSTNMAILYKISQKGMDFAGERLMQDKCKFNLTCRAN